MQITALVLKLEELILVETLNHDYINKWTLKVDSSCPNK